MDLSVVTSLSSYMRRMSLGKRRKYARHRIDAEYDLWFDLFESLREIIVELPVTIFCARNRPLQHTFGTEVGGCTDPNAPLDVAERKMR